MPSADTIGFVRHSICKRLIAILTLFVAAHGLARAQPCPPDPKPFTPELFAAAAAKAQDRGLLWRITHGGHSSYLYGTLHVGRAEWMAPGPKIKQALMQTDVIGLELDPLDVSLQQQMRDATSAVNRKLPASLETRLANRWKAECLPQEARTGPSELQVSALGMAAGRRDGFDAVYGTEIMLSLLSRGLQRPVVSLESVALQMKVLLAEDDQEAAEMVGDALDHLEQGRLSPMLRQTARMWEQGDLASLERYAEWCDCMDTETDRKMMKRAMEDRNPGLADAIAGIHKSGKKIFAAVGALHMAGPNGIPALMRERGFKVERLR
jgi:uncharacterized protein